MKERTWLGILLSFAAPCRGKMAASVVLAILSVAGGFVPYLRFLYKGIIINHNKNRANLH